LREIRKGKWNKGEGKQKKEDEKSNCINSRPSVAGFST
jgi:hypothetical protein